MVEKADEDLDGSLDVGKEGLSGGGEDVSDGVGGDFLLDGDTRVNSSKELLELVCVVLDVEELRVVLLVNGGVSVGFAVGAAEGVDGGLDSGVDISLLCAKEEQGRSQSRKEKGD